MWRSTNIKTNGGKQMKLTVKPEQKITDGTHEGVIIGVEYRTKPYEYTDFIIEFEENKRLKVGYPTLVSPVSKLGILLSNFGVELVIGKEVEPEALIGRKCTFLTMTKQTDRGTFANIVPGSLKAKE
jgi:hypothetical protein